MRRERVSHRSGREQKPRLRRARRPIPRVYNDGIRGPELSCLAAPAPSDAHVASLQKANQANKMRNVKQAV